MDFSDIQIWSVGGEIYFKYYAFYKKYPHALFKSIAFVKSKVNFDMTKITSFNVEIRKVFRGRDHFTTEVMTLTFENDENNKKKKELELVNYNCIITDDVKGYCDGLISLMEKNKKLEDELFDAKAKFEHAKGFFELNNF